MRENEKDNQGNIESLVLPVKSGDERRMNILIVIDNFKDDGLDGIGNVAFRITNGILTFLPHHDLTVLYEKTLESFLRERINLSTRPIKLIPFKHPRLKIARVLRKTFLCVKESLNEKYDQVIYVAPPVPIPLIFRKNLTTVVHDLTPFKHSRGQSLTFRLYYRLIIWIALNASKKILAVSHYTRNELLIHFPAKKHKIEVLYNTIPGEIWSRQSPENYFLIVSTIQPGKNIETALVAFAEFKKLLPTLNYKLIIAGKYGWGPLSIFDLPVHLGIGDSVNFLGYVSENYLGQLYSKARCLINVSIAEGFGLPVLEAMYHGVPAIVSENSALSEVAGLSCIQVNPLSARQICSAMVLMTGMQRQILSDITRQEVSRFDSEKNIRDIFDN